MTYIALEDVIIFVPMTFWDVAIFVVVMLIVENNDAPKRMVECSY
jgi:hypothetical protein